MNRDEILSEINEIYVAYGVTPEDVSRLTKLNHELVWGDVERRILPRLSELSKTMGEMTEVVYEAGLLIASSRPVDESEARPE